MILVLDPLSKPVAITEILLLLALAGFIGWLIGRWLTNSRIQTLKNDLTSLQGELTDCRNTNSREGIAPVSRAFAENIKADNLKIIEGIGPKIEQLLNTHGIKSFAKLAESSPEYINDILQNSGPRFKMHDAGTWPQQAALARDEKWEELTALQNQLEGGKHN